MSCTFIAITGWIVLGMAWNVTAATSTGGTDFERYQVILDRKPFGEIIPSEPAVAAATNVIPTEALTKELALRAIIDPGENLPLRAGFLDKKTKKTFYLGVGEKNETYELVAVNYDNEEVVLKRGTESTIFNLKPNKTNTAPTGAASAPGAPAGFRPMNIPGAEPPRGFTPVPLSDSKRPFFSDVKKRKFSPFKPMGTNMPAPFQTRSLESFMKPNTNMVHGFPGQLRPFSATGATGGPGDTIDKFMRANPDAARAFSPFKPPDPHAADIEASGTTAEGFLMQDPDRHFPAQNLFSVPNPEYSDDTED